MCIYMCTDVYINDMHINMYRQATLAGAWASVCIDMCIADMHIKICTGKRPCRGQLASVCTGMRIDMCIDMYIDMYTGQ